jgi:hypothetical protein
LTTSASNKRRFNKARQTSRRRLRRHKQTRSKAREARKASKLLKRYKVSKGKITANLALLRAREALTHKLLLLQGALP